MSLRGFLGIVGSLFGVAATTQAAADVPTFTLKSAVQTALGQNPAVREAREHVSELQGTYYQARAALFPNVSATASATQRKDAVNVNSGGTAKFGGDSYNQYAFDFHVAQPLFQWGVISGVALPGYDRDLGEIALDILARDTEASMINGFYKLLLDQRFLDSLLRIEAIQKEALSTAERRHRIGRGQLLDVLQVKTQLALLLPQIAQASTQSDIDTVQFANFLGDMRLKEVRLQGSFSNFKVSTIRPKLTRASEYLPEYKRALLNEQRLSEEKDFNLGKDLPSLAAIGDWGRSSYTKSDLLASSATAWSIGVQLTIPLFSGLSTIYERRAYTSKAKELDLEQSNVENNLSLAQIQSEKTVEYAEESIRSSETAYNLALASMKEATRNYRLATIDFLQFLSVQQAYLQAESTLDQARYNYITALVNYFRASGYALDQLVDLLGAET